MAAAVRYVKPRNGVFQYSRRVPNAVQERGEQFRAFFDSKPLFRRSLKTKDQGAMHLAALSVHQEFERRVAAAMGRPRRDPVTSEAPLRKLTQADLDALREQYKELTYLPFERAYLQADSGPEGAEEWQRLNDQLEVDAEQLREVIRVPGAQSNDPRIEPPASIADFVISTRGFDAPAGSAERGSIIAAIRAGRELGYKHVEALHSGEALPRLSTDAKKGDGGRQLTLREAVARYLDHKRLPAKTTSEVKLSLRTFESVVGNKSLDALTPSDFHDFVKNLAAQTVGGNSVGSVKRPMAAQTIKKRIGFLNAAINGSMDRKEFAGPNPASGIKVDAYVTKPDLAIIPKKRRFKIGELNSLFQHPWFTGCKSNSITHQAGKYRLEGAEYWAPMIALWTGCRASELGGLRLAEILIDDPYPHLVIRDNQYRRTKGGYARNVPILDALIEHGFRDYLDRIRATSADRLFPDWTSPKRTGDWNKDDAAWSNAKIIRAFNRTVIPAALKDVLIEGARREVTFHSFRGAFKALLASADYKLHPNLINEVIGHAKSQMDGRYLGEVPLEETYPAVKECRYTELVLPSVP